MKVQIPAGFVLIEQENQRKTEYFVLESKKSARISSINSSLLIPHWREAPDNLPSADMTSRGTASAVRFAFAGMEKRYLPIRPRVV